MFVNRLRELRSLNEIYKRKTAQFIAIYGRRRIGKTALLNHWLDTAVKADGIYWVAHRSSSKILLDDFSATLAPLFGVESGALSFASWDALFIEVAKLCEKRRIVLVIDEFPYLIESVPSLTTQLQSLWDHKFSKGRIVLVACGSHFNMMRREFLQDSGPLFGRTTADIHLDEIEPQGIHHFLTRYSTQQLIETYSVIGGVPKYLELWDDRKPVARNIEELLLSSVTIFRQEPMFLIQDEIPEVRTYMGILDAIGSGQKQQKAIGEKCGIPLPHVGKYLHTLQSLGFVTRNISVDSPNMENSRATGYEIKDRFLRFYFSLLRPYLPLLEQNRTVRVAEIIRTHFPQYVARNGFEAICRQHVAILGDRGDLSFHPHYVGRIWNRNAEIDVAAVDQKSKSMLLGECKWTDRPVGEEILSELCDKARQFKNIAGYKMHFALFAKAGFTAALTKKAGRDGVLLYTPKDIMV